MNSLPTSFVAEYFYSHCTEEDSEAGIGTGYGLTTKAWVFSGHLGWWVLKSDPSGTHSTTTARPGLLSLPAPVSRGRLCCAWLEILGEVGTGWSEEERREERRGEERRGEEASFKSSWIWGALSNASVMAGGWGGLLPRLTKWHPHCCPRTKLKLLNSRLLQLLLPANTCIFPVSRFQVFVYPLLLPWDALSAQSTPTHPSISSFSVNSSRSFPGPPPPPPAAKFRHTSCSLIFGGIYHQIRAPEMMEANGLPRKCKLRPERGRHLPKVTQQEGEAIL